ncbi:MAG: NrfD/PsrC family molybdoenzyme membrane anchor subunit [Dehalococcoidales bacterium]|jgi:formate-dependent nitrite reductase membrane component NrfD
MQAHQWMINYTRQSEWIDRRGIFLWIAFYTGGLGGGLFLVSLFFNSIWGMLIGWLIVSVIKGGTHLIFLGKPLRFWRIFLHPQTSWLARGFLFVVGFGLTGGIALLIHVVWPGNPAEMVFKVLAGILAFCVAIYTGFVLKAIKGVPFWNSWLLPVLFIMCGVLGGFGLAVVIAINGGGINLHQAEIGSRWLLAINILLIVIYLWLASRRQEVGKQSVLEQIHGHSAPIFWAGIVVLGIIVPLVVTIIGLAAGEVNSAVLVGGVICEIIGGLALRYCVLKAGAYNPLVAISPAEQHNREASAVPGAK